MGNVSCVYGNVFLKPVNSQARSAVITDERISARRKMRMFRENHKRIYKVMDSVKEIRIVRINGKAVNDGIVSGLCTCTRCGMKTHDAAGHMRRVHGL